VAFDPQASETTLEEIAHVGPEEAGLESAFWRASENRLIAGYHAVMGMPANSSLEKQPSQSGRDPRTPEPKSGPHAPRRGRLFHLLWPVTSYVVTNVTVTLLWLVFFAFSRTVVIGRRNVGEERNTLLLSNHQSMLDSFLVGLAAFYPQSWLKPHVIPWNPAAAENFYKNPLLAWLADNWKCIWVREGRRDLHALHRMIQVLPRGVMTVFPEGTRSRDGTVGPGRPGTGLLILATRPRLIPVAIDGMQAVLPIGRYLPRLFKRIAVSFGSPVDYTDLLAMPRTRETAQAVVDRVMAAIRVQHAELRQRRSKDGSRRLR